MAKSPVVILYDASGNPVSVVSDSGVYRLSMLGKLLSASGTQINPATEDGNLASIKAKTDNIPSDPAKESGKLTSLETILTAIRDTAGIKKITDSLPEGDNGIGRVKVWDGTSVADVLSYAAIRRLRVEAQEFELATFIATAQGVVLGNGKSLLSLVNASGSTVVARVREIWLSNASTTAITGVVALFEGRRITGHSGGSGVTPLPHDTADSLSGSLSALTGATVAGEAASGLFARRVSSDDWGPGTLDVEGMAQGLFTMGPVWRVAPPLKPIVLRANEGLSFKCATNTTAGSFDVTFVFTQETP